MFVYNQQQQQQQQQRHYIARLRVTASIAPVHIRCSMKKKKKKKRRKKVASQSLSQQQQLSRDNAAAAAYRTGEKLGYKHTRVLYTCAAAAIRIRRRDIDMFSDGAPYVLRDPDDYGIHFANRAMFGRRKSESDDDDDDDDHCRVLGIALSSQAFCLGPCVVL
ncbi:unnamed protein product [Trichogramma brassicae]|uniref:Uncharacterized protein n=1 Tax=Trichogramma brassicae TaxID=86971 RepID=A0A6H5I380_9HYME|nr:unnamed protein product [Trichogramma brassicae]